MSTTPLARPADPEAEIRALSAQWLAAFHERDLDAMLRHYAPDVQLYDLKPPLVLRGLAAVRRMWEECLPYMTGITGYDFHEVTVHAGPEVAFYHCLSHMTGTGSPGHDIDHWMRVTIGFHRIEGQWRVVHEHVSVPVHMEPPFAGAFDLQP